MLASGLPPSQPSAHALLITNQCAGCHLQTADYQSESEPAITGHSFRVGLYGLCLECHPFQPDQLVALTQYVISNRVQQVKAALDYWGTTAAPDELRTNFGAASWEYVSAGELSPGATSPTDAQQVLIPTNILKARFNLYLVLYDGSYGVHNVFYTQTLLDTAENWVLDEIFP